MSSFGHYVEVWRYYFDSGSIGDVRHTDHVIVRYDHSVLNGCSPNSWLIDSKRYFNLQYLSTVDNLFDEEI
jgi:hypothetical protein